MVLKSGSLFLCTMCCICCIGCSGVSVVDRLYSSLPAGGVNRILRNEEVLAKEYVVKDVVYDEGLERVFDVSIQGNIDFETITRYVCGVLGLVYVKKSGSVYEVIDIEVVGKYTERELWVIYENIASESGLVVSRDLGVVIVNELASVVGYRCVRYVPLLFSDNKCADVEGVKMRKLTGGVLLVGEKSLVLSLAGVLRMLDVDYLSGVKISFVPYSYNVCESVKKVLDVVFQNDVYFMRVNEDVSCLVLRSERVEGVVMGLLKSYAVVDRQNFYVVPVRQGKLELLGSKIREAFPGMSFIFGDNCVLVSAKKDYENLLSLVRKLDFAERLVSVEVYLVDIQSRSTKNWGWDIKKVGTRGFSTSLRSSVGLGLYSTFGDFSIFMNYLMSEFDGKVLNAPHGLVVNGGSLVMSFGQDVPTLQSKSSTNAGELIQNVAYVSTGLSMEVKVSLISDVIYADVSLQNSSVLEDVGVEGNPQFSSDSVKMPLVLKSGNVAVIAGLRRAAKEYSKKSVFFPFSIFRKGEMREVLVCVGIKEVSFDVESDVLEKIKKIFLDSVKN